MCGTHPFPISAKNAPTVGVMPIGEYSHVTDGICVIGIGVYRGNKYESLDGIYFVADWGSGKIWGMERDKDGQWQMQEMPSSDSYLLPRYTPIPITQIPSVT